MTKQMRALLMIAEHPRMRNILMPAIDVERERFNVSRVNYGVLSGGEKALVSWAWCIWKDEQVPEDDGGDPEFKFNILGGIRDPFESFGVLGRDLQILVAQSLLHRWS